MSGLKGKTLIYAMINSDSVKTLLEKVIKVSPIFQEAWEKHDKLLKFFIESGEKFKKELSQEKYEGCEEYMSKQDDVVLRPHNSSDILLVRLNVSHPGENDVYGNNKFADSITRFELKKYNFPKFLYGSTSLIQRQAAAEKGGMEEYCKFISDAQALADDLAAAINKCWTAMRTLKTMLTDKDMTLSKLKAVSPVLYKIYKDE